MPNQVVLMDGKEKAILTLFNQQNFGYLAIGSKGATESNELFEPTTVGGDWGFTEVQSLDDSTYLRISLTPTGKKSRDTNTGKVTIEFQADLEFDNIQIPRIINQFGICDNSDENNEDTEFLIGVAHPNVSKNERIGLSFVIDIRL